MRVDGHITSSSRQTLALSVRNVLLRFGISILLGHTEIYYMNHVRAFGVRTADEEVVGFDVSVDQILLVNSLNSR